jgi:hypothetical protein
VLLGCASFTLAFFLPIYTDEIVWKAYHGRMWYDDFQSIGSFLTCGAYAFPTPLLLVPFRLIDTAIYEELTQPLAIRAIGLALAATWGGLVWWLLGPPLGKMMSKWGVAAAIIAFHTLGVMPFLLVLNRPEQVLLIAMTLFTIPLLQDQTFRKRGLFGEIAAAFGFVLFCGYVLAAHPLAIFMIPLMLIFLVRFLAMRSTITLGAVAIVAIGATAFLDWTQRWKCGDPKLELVFVRDSIVSAMQAGKLGPYLEMWLQRCWSDFKTLFYLSEFLFKSHYTAGLLPGVPKAIWLPLSTVTFLLFAFVLLSGAWAFALVVADFTRARRGLVPLLTLGWMWAFYACSVLARLVRNDYQAELMEPLMVLMAGGSLWVARDLIIERLGARRSRNMARGTFAALIGVSVLSQVALLAYYTPYAFGSWTDPGYTSEQKYSVTGFGYDSLRPKILETAALCNIDPSRHPRHLVVDELTYFTLQAAREPFFATYLEDGHGHWGAGIADIRSLLESWDSAGMVIGCQWVPRKLQSEAVRNGEFCCLRGFGQ